VLEYFNSTHGARKGLADTALKTANSGYLTRRLVDVAQDCIITSHDCGTKGGIAVRAIIDSGTVVASLSSRILGRTTAEDVKDPSSSRIVIKRDTLLGEKEVDEIVKAHVQELRIRSVLTCENTNGVCGACYGRDLARGTPVNMGEAVGVIAAQSIGEPGTQLTMRTFHIGGAAQISEQSFIESNFDGKVVIKSKGKNAVVKNSDGQWIAMGRSIVVAVVDPDGTERAVHRIQNGARMRVEDGEEIKRGARIAEWDPYTRPILTETDGTVGFEDLVEGQSMSETVDESTGIAKRVVTDWRTSSRAADLRPAIVIKGKDGKVQKLARGGDARYMLAVDAILSADLNASVKAGDVIARIPTESAKTRDITGGLPRVAELFEARRPKEAAVIAEMAGTVQFGKDYKNKRRLSIVPADGGEPAEYLIPKGKHIHLQDGDSIEKGDYIVDGNPAPHDILAIKGVEELANYLVNEIQDVYRLQGVAINDKHIEVIVRQMLQKVELTDIGETDMIHAEQMDKLEFDEINAKFVAEGKKPATAHPVLLGITKASLQTRSFISAASFQETTRVLTEAAVNGKADTLDGLKENVIVGRLIPAGTGAMMGELREVATKRDSLILDEREKEAAARAAAAVAPAPAEQPAALPAAE
jgi:DNA-directed RNA polymerase subunit beta'